MIESDEPVEHNPWENLHWLERMIDETTLEAVLCAVAIAIALSVFLPWCCYCRRFKDKTE
jgi:phage terminase large subunit